MEHQGSDRFEQLKQMYAKEDLGACFANLHLKIEGDIHKVKEDVAGLKARTEHLEKFATESELAIRTINDTSVPALQKAIKDSKDELSHEITKLEMWGRKWNVIIRGIPGSANEGGRVTLTKVTEFFKNTLKVPAETVDDMEFQACHRLPGGTEVKNNIILRFANLLDRDDVLSYAMKLPPKSGYSVVVDLPKSVAMLRGLLLKKRSEMPVEDRKKCKLVFRKEYPFLALVKK